MRVTFDSSHVTGDFSSGRLAVKIRVEDDALGLTTWDEVEFGVPPNYHVHNDCVGAALMTLVGTRYALVTFNFPISRDCADTLARFYVGVEIGPVDRSLEPHRPGRRIGLNFSGGLDSTGALHLLRAVAGDDLAVITSAYGGFFEFEEVGYSQSPRDVTCPTNLRQRRFDRFGRFNCAVPLLFADYLDLEFFATGHTVNQSKHGIDRPAPGERPGFVHLDLAVNAAGLCELHIVRSLHSFGLSKIIFALAPEQLERATVAVGPTTREKYYTKARLLTYLYEDARLPLPPYLRNLALPRSLIPLGNDLGQDLRLLFIAKRDGPAEARRIAPKLRQCDLSLVEGMSLAFLWRYHPDIAQLLPPVLRERVLAVFALHGIEPYDERDWQEIAAIRSFLESVGARYMRTDG